MILYHLGNRCPSPKPTKVRREKHSFQEGDKGVFLSPNWKKIANFHFGLLPSSRYRKLYTFSVSQSVIAKAGGLQKVDRATEIFIPENLWSQVKLLSSREFGYKHLRERLELSSVRNLAVDSADLRVSKDSRKKITNGMEAMSVLSRINRKKDLPLILSALSPEEMAIIKRVAPRFGLSL